MRYKVYVRRLKAVFPDDADLSAIFVRMSVLYEDLRIENLGAMSSEGVPPLDVLPSIYRKLYFVRRSLISLTEFAGCVRLLNQRPEFQPILRSLDKEGQQRWREASEFFAKNQQKITQIEQLRHEFGGHFKKSTAEELLAWMDSDVPGLLEIAINDAEGVAGPRLRYAYEFVAGVFAKDLGAPKELMVEQIAASVRDTFQMILEGWDHTVKAMHTVALAVLLPRFEG